MVGWVYIWNVIIYGWVGTEMECDHLWLGGDRDGRRSSMVGWGQRWNVILYGGVGTQMECDPLWWGGHKDGM